MSHLVTWPELYKDMGTMVSYAWNAEDLNQKIDDILINYNEYIDIEFGSIDIEQNNQTHQNNTKIG